MAVVRNLLLAEVLLDCVVLALLVISVSGDFMEKPTRSCKDNELCESCTLCAPGFETVQACSEGMDTICKQCVHGQTFNPVAGTHVTCRPCKGCPINSRLKRSCNITHNTECECERDFYIDLVTGTCKPCTACTHGLGALRPCSSLHNTVCRSCPFGTYNNVHSTTLGCLPCTQCKEGQFILHRCTHIQDTICADSDVALNGRQKLSANDAELPEDRQETSDSVIAVYCALLASVVFGLLIYVAVKQCRAKPPTKTASNGLAPLTVPLCPPRTTQIDMEVASSRSDRSRRMGSSELHPVIIVNEAGKEYKAAYMETRLRNISLAQRREMEVLLDARSGEDWRLLAETLGYSASRISVLEQRALEKQMSPARCLLSDWSKREESSVQSLAEALSDIGRHDVALVLMRQDDRMINGSSRPLDIL